MVRKWWNSFRQFECVQQTGPDATSSTSNHPAREICARSMTMPSRSISLAPPPRRNWSGRRAVLSSFTPSASSLRKFQVICIERRPRQKKFRRFSSRPSSGLPPSKLMTILRSSGVGALGRSSACRIRRISPARRLDLLAQHVDVLDRRLQELARAAAVGHAVAGDRIEGGGDVGALQPRLGDVQQRIFLPLIGQADHLEQVAMPFDDHCLLVNRLSVRGRP